MSYSFEKSVTKSLIARVEITQHQVIHYFVAFLQDFLLPQTIRQSKLSPPASLVVRLLANQGVADERLVYHRNL